MPQNPERLDQSRSRPSAVRPNRYMDILFLTALEEEKFVLDQLFPTNPGIGQVLDVQYTRSEIAFDATLRTPCVQLNIECYGSNIMDVPGRDGERICI